MQRHYITPESCVAISKAIHNANMKQYDVAKLIGKSTSMVCRLCTGKAKWVELDVIRNLETILDIKISTVPIPDILDESNDMVREILQLREENKLLKQLLIDKWSKEVNNDEGL